MSQEKLSDEVRRFLESHFPGSSIDDGYYFVILESAAWRRVRDDPFELLQRVADRVSERSFWLICVGADPRDLVPARVAEQQTTLYTPDWNVQQELPQWFLAVDPVKFDLRRMLRALGSPAALVFIDPARRIIFDARYRRVHATSEGDLDAFFAGIEDSAGSKG